ncbi:MAG: type IV pilus assembly protein PilM [Candidatus Aureabacteria bacterium]|nr:type IV pilus assembly protein PilM [Candidatus Auribacterota bacterium]
MKIDLSSWMKSRSAHHAVGIDIGASFLKAVCMKKSGGGIRITGLFAAELAREDSARPAPEVIAETLKKLVADNRIPTGHCVSSFPLSSAIVRNAIVPFTGKSRIRQVIKFQAEPHIPFAVEEVVVDFHEIGVSDGDKTMVTIVAAKKELIGKHLELFTAAGVDPKILSVDVFALINNFLFRAGGKLDDEMVALVDIGATKTLVALLKGGAVLLTRSITGGGDDLTEAIQNEFSLDFRNAESLKREKGVALLTDRPSEEEGKLHKAISPVLSRFVSEVDRSLRAASAPLKGAALAKFYLSGGGSLLREMREFCAREFGCETLYLSDLAPLEGAEGENALCGMGVAAGLAIQGIGLGKAEIDLRQEEFIHTGPLGKIKRQLAIAMVLGLCAAGLGIYQFLSSFIHNRNEYSLLTDKLEQVYGETFPDKGKVKATAVVSVMEQKLKEYQELYKSFSTLSSGALSSLEILREVSALIPKDLKSQITDFAIGQGKLEIEGLVSNPADADEIKKALEGSEYFRSVDVPSTSAAEGDKYKFKLLAELRGQASG